jgi:hypothetical protein
MGMWKNDELCEGACLLVTGILTYSTGTDTFSPGKARKSAFSEHKKEPGR